MLDSRSRGTGFISIQSQIFLIFFSAQLLHFYSRCDVGHFRSCLAAAPSKLAKICPMLTKTKAPGCTTKHYTDCIKDVVYEVPMSCSKVYIGQTGRCYNDRAQEHKWMVKNNAGGHMSEHCKRCKCTPMFEKTRFLRRANDKLECEIIEVFYIKKAGDKCISESSVTLSEREAEFLERDHN